MSKQSGGGLTCCHGLLTIEMATIADSSDERKTKKSI